MSELIRVVDGAPEVYSVARLSRDNPNVSFPRSFPSSVLAEYGCYRVTEVAKPSDNHVRDGWESVNGQWRQKWRERTPGEQAADLESKRSKTRVALHQFREALIDEGHAAAVQAVIQGLTGAQKAKVQVRIESKPRIGRTETWAVQILTAAGLTDQQIDDLFTAAAAID